MMMSMTLLLAQPVVAELFTTATTPDGAAVAAALRAMVDNPRDYPGVIPMIWEQSSEEDTMYRSRTDEYGITSETVLPHVRFNKNFPVLAESLGPNSLIHCQKNYDPARTEVDPEGMDATITPTYKFDAPEDLRMSVVFEYSFPTPPPLADMLRVHYMLTYDDGSDYFAKVVFWDNEDEISGATGSFDPKDISLVGYQRADLAKLRLVVLVQSHTTGKIYFAEQQTVGKAAPPENFHYYSSNAKHTLCWDPPSNSPSAVTRYKVFWREKGIDPFPATNTTVDFQNFAPEEANTYTLYAYTAEDSSSVELTIPISDHKTAYLAVGTINSGTQAPSPANTYQKNLRQQFFFSHGELDILSDKVDSNERFGITKIGFEITDFSDVALTDMTIRLAPYDGGGTVEQYDGPWSSTTTVAAQTYSVNGFTMITLDSPFVWNNKSGILVDVSFGPNTAVASKGSVSMMRMEQGSKFIWNSGTESLLEGVLRDLPYRPSLKIEFDNALSDDDPILVRLTSKLGANYPNPFNPSTTIAFDIHENTNVLLEVYNVKGQLVKTLVNKHFDRGQHTVTWDGKNDNGTTVSSGIYLYKMKTNSHNEVKKMLMMK